MKPAEEWARELESASVSGKAHALQLDIARRIQADAKRDCAEQAKAAWPHLADVQQCPLCKLEQQFIAEADRLEGK